MADEFDDDDELGEGDGSGSGGGLKKMLLFVGAPVLLLVIGGAVAYFLGAFDSFFGPSPEELEAEQQQLCDVHIGFRIRYSSYEARQ